MREVFDELRAAAHAVWHRRWLALAVAWGVCVLGWLAVALVPNSYESKARIFVQLDDVLSEEIGIANTAEDDILRLRQTLASAVNLEKVIRSTKLGEGLADQRAMDKAIEGLAEDVTVQSEEDNLFELTATIGEPGLSEGENALLAQDVVQKLIDIFREENIAGNRGEVAETIVFLDQQLDERKRELEEAEARRLGFEAQNPELIGGSSTLSSRLGQLRSETRSAEADLAAAQSALAAINGQLAGTPRTLSTPGASGGGPATRALAEAQGQLAGLQARGLTRNHPDVIAAERQVALLRRQAAGEGPEAGGSTPNPAYSSLLSIRAERQANVQALQARRAALGSDVAAAQADQASEPAVAAEMTRIGRDYEVLKKNYDELLQRREDMRLRGQVENERSSFRFEVIDPPMVPQKPAAPNRPLLLIGVLLLGLGAGAGAAFLAGKLRSSFSSAEQLERAMRLPVLGTISRNLTQAAKALDRKRSRQFLAGSAALGGLCLLLVGIEIAQVSLAA